jgi:hypothetical protein
METNNLCLTDLVAAFAPKINEAWGEVVASGELHVGKLIAVGKLLKDAKDAGEKAGKKWMTEVAPALTAQLQFGIGKAEKLMGMADEPLLADDSSNWKILPPHLSALDELRKLDNRVGKGTLARLLAGEVILDGKVISRTDINDLTVKKIKRSSRVKRKWIRPPRAVRSPSSSASSPTILWS